MSTELRERATSGVASVEATESIKPTPNLILLRTAVHQYRNLGSDLPEYQPNSPLNPKFTTLESGIIRIVNPQTFNENNAQLALLDFGQRYNRRLVQRIKGNPSLDINEERTRALGDYRDFLQFERSFLEKVKADPALGDPVQVEEFCRGLEAPYRSDVLHWTRSLGESLYERDVLDETTIPIKEIEQKTAGQSKLAGLVNGLKHLARAYASPELKAGYRDTLNTIVKEEDGLVEYNLDFDLMDFHRDIPTDNNRGSAISDLISNPRDFKENWLALGLTQEQNNATYELVSKDLFSLLKQYDSNSKYDQDRVSDLMLICKTLGNPSAVLDLTSYLQERNSDSWDGQPMYAAWDIASQPGNEEIIEKLIVDAPNIDKRIIEEWILGKNPIMRKVYYAPSTVRYMMPDAFKKADEHLARGDMLVIAEGIAEQQGASLDYMDVTSFFFDHGDRTLNISSLLANSADAKPQLETLIAKSEFIGWKALTPEIFNALVNPEDKNYYSLPKTVAEEGLSLSNEAVAKLELLYQSRDLQTGIRDRVDLIEGMLHLKTKPEGKNIMENLLNGLTITEANGVKRVARADAGRIKQALRYLGILDSMGTANYSAKASLSEVVGDLREKVVGAIKNKMDLNENDQISNLEGVLGSGIVDIVPTLMARYQNLGMTNVTGVIKEIGRHVLMGDFLEWRNNLPTAAGQLEILGDKKNDWTEPVPPIEIDMITQSDLELRFNVTETIARIAEEAKAHIGEIYKFDFTPQRINQIKLEIEPVISQLKDTAISDELRKDLGQRRRTLESQIKIIEGVVDFETLDSKTFDPDLLKEKVSTVKNALAEFAGMEQPIIDLSQIEQVLDSQDIVKNTHKLKAQDTDDPLVLLKVGVEPRQTCQSWMGGGYNYCLPAYVADVNKRAINVTNEKGEVLARSMIKLSHIVNENGERTPVVLMEPIYSLSESAPIYRAVVKVALEKAKNINGVVVLGNEIQALTGADHKKTIPVLEQEVKKGGFEIERPGVAYVFVPQSFNQSEYSDLLRGRVSTFNTYMDIQNPVIVRAVTVI